jgi:hypothetical protein
MSNGAINFNLDALDDPVLPDQIPSFEGGQFSNLRANLLQTNASKLLGNVDVDRLGKLRTRRGTIVIETTAGSGPPSEVAGTIIQGLTSYQTSDANYVVCANDSKLWAWNGSAWVRIGLGGTADREDIFIARTGQINNPPTGTPPVGGYAIGDTELIVDLVTGVVDVGEKLYFTTNLRRDYYEYTIAAVVGGATPTKITLEEPGLVFDVKDNWKFTVLRPAKVKHPTPGNRYAAATTTIAIDGYTGVVNDGEKFVIKSENVTHTVAVGGHTETGGNTTGLTFTPALQADWVADNDDVPVIFAQGNDQLFFSDGTGPIYGWKGGIPNVAGTIGGGTLMKISSHSLLDNFAGNFATTRTKPPQDVKVLLWFQNRLIASGIATEPDAIYFSDFFDASAWDADYQKVRIGGGESDPITGCLAWTDLNMLVFKKNSCYLINLDPSQNPNPDDPTLLVASFAVKQLHKLIGCPAPNTAVQVGGGSTTPGSDVFFVDGDKKVHSIRRVMAAETQQEVGQAVSLPIQDVLDTINIDHIGTACAMYHNEHYILGIPSMRGADGGLLPNATVAYNMLTQSWCGVWSWAPTCFARRTDLGSYSKLIFGDWRTTPGVAATGRVLQWMDDLSLDEETDTTYNELVPRPPLVGVGFPIVTSILTRAITGGDMYSYKTGLNVEFEFDESVADEVFIKVILDKVTKHDPATGSDTIAVPFSSLSEPRLRLPFTLPARLPESPGMLRKAFDLQRYGTWRELQFFITTLSGKLALRSIRLTFFMDTIRIQTIPTDPGEVFEPPPTLPFP